MWVATTMKCALGKLGIGTSHWYYWHTLRYRSFVPRLWLRQLKRGQQRTETVIVDVAGSQAVAMAISLLYLQITLQCLALVNLAATKTRAFSAVPLPTSYLHNALDKREPLPITTELKRITYPSSLSDQQWAAAQQVIPVHRIGRPCIIDLRQVLNALCYMQANHFSWRMLPAEFTNWKTVSSYLYRWRQQGVWQSICEAIRIAE